VHFRDVGNWPTSFRIIGADRTFPTTETGNLRAAGAQWRRYIKEIGFTGQ
jgi:hypothetical protein